MCHFLNQNRQDFDKYLKKKNRLRERDSPPPHKHTPKTKRNIKTENTGTSNNPAAEFNDKDEIGGTW